MNAILSNAQRAALIPAIKAADATVKAGETLASKAAALAKAGLKAADLQGAAKGKPEGAHFASVKALVAETVLSKADFALFQNDTLATTKTLKGKRVATPKGKVNMRVNSVMARLRAALDAATKTPDKRGAQGQKATPTQTFFKVMDDYVARLSKDDASDTFDFDPLEARAALVAMLANLR